MLVDACSVNLGEGSLVMGNNITDSDHGAINATDTIYHGTAKGTPTTPLFTDNHTSTGCQSHLAPAEDDLDVVAIVGDIVGSGGQAASDELSVANTVQNENMNEKSTKNDTAKLYVNVDQNAEEDLKGNNQHPLVSPGSSCQYTTRRPHRDANGNDGNISPISEASSESNPSEQDELEMGKEITLPTTTPPSCNEVHRQTIQGLANWPTKDKASNSDLPDDEEFDEHTSSAVDSIPSNQLDNLYGIVLQSICSPCMSHPSRRKRYSTMQFRLRQLRLRTSDVSGSHRKPEEESPDQNACVPNDIPRLNMSKCNTARAIASQSDRVKCEIIYHFRKKGL